MRFLCVICLIVTLSFGVKGLPVTPSKKPEGSPGGSPDGEKVAEQGEHQPKYEEQFDPNDPRANLENVLEYKNYLQEVVSVLESDPDFREKLNKVDEVDIRTGKIAQELDYVNHHVRTKLDEIKRTELERLRQLAIKHFEMSNDIDREHLKIPEHLDHTNQHTFEVEDLKKLIQKASSDLTEADKLRREEFKRYEMQKEFEKQERLRTMDEEHRKKYEEELKKMQEKHNKHDKIHHPGGQAQLEEVWEKQDHMEGQDFDPKTFFMMHDLDGNGFWDEMEVKALFVKELDKVYQAGVPEDDMKERAEEMERMREHVFKEADVNKDNLISYAEFLDQTRKQEFRQDEGWDTVDKQPQYTHEEYLAFERKRQEEIQRLISQGMLPPHPNMPQGYYPGPQGPYQAPGGHPQQQYHPNQIPPQNFHPNQIPQQPNNPQHFQPPPQQVHQQQLHQQPPPKVVAGVGQKPPPLQANPPQAPPPQAPPSNHL
ncbi:NUCB1 [Sergentomyia squamirostris]